MAGRVSLEVVSGPIQGRQFGFDAHDTFLFGRAPDCHAELAPNDATASRHHFLLEVNPPAARLRDLGSLNGTYVNGTRYGGRRLDETPEEAAGQVRPEVDLRDGDLIRVGATTFAVRIEGAGSGADSTGPASRAAGPVSESMAPTDTGVRSAPPQAITGYEMGGLLGRGGMGAVYRARRKSDGAVVALKLLRPEVVVDAHAREVFLREIGITARLRHPNLVTLLEHGCEGEAFFFAMEYCAGGSLASMLLQCEGPLVPREAVGLTLQVLDGLDAAHAQGFVHRDIKPENVLLADETRSIAKLTDFGLAKSFEQAGLSGMTATGAAGGTLYFMPREQLTSFRRLQPASDVWSMAATLYHMLTLSYPRDFRPDMDPLQVILSGAMVPIADREPTLPGALTEVVDRALSNDLEVRYRSARELGDALRQALA